ncbi:putative C6 transcription factor [Aspergillus mulundensis]|uniref:Putative Zn(II)2Cys6 transcription factor n=1 Tax=Aspergillus mulundensis TaxID=1810919 RepID=A0A3D8SVL9_9EURO|nr:putative Zn(II)2Cys6 transcription factor [Aspergillus mulundensis]RDW90211.1 putative Zn(II)2Cys6 transcription factor [Aspergillus mulundensis]
MADAPSKPNPSRKSAFSAPTLAYTKQLERRVAELEDALSKHCSQQTPDAAAGTPSSAASTNEASLKSTVSNRKDDEADDDQDLSRDFEGLKVEHDGRVSFHGPTSLFQLPSGALNPAISNSQLAEQAVNRKERLVNNAWRERAIEQMATMPEPFQYLLDSHWCWIQPLFNFVYRPAFTRDMKLNGPYYSDALLHAILSHSVRWCKTEPRISPLLEQYEGGAVFWHRAVSGLHDSLRDGHVDIPTIQTMLLLSARECGQGNRTQAWLYSGMAFRMLDDLGITIDSRKYSDSAQLSDEDIEIRNRLFWSCYFWDKMMSLYFGRSPTLQSSQGCPPRTILDDTSESEPWTPHGVVFPDGSQYPPTQAHSTSCFIEMCGLMEILNQILVHIYDHSRQISEAEFHSCVREQSRNLGGWWDNLPEHLKLVPTDLPPYSPPSHVVTLNCLYHTINILTHRPILCSKWSREAYDKSHLVHCMTSATAILSIFSMYRRTFGESHIVLSIAYSVYTAASIFLLEIQALKHAAPGTLDKLKICIFALEGVRVSSPVITTALSLIYQEIQRLRVDHNIPLSIPQQNAPQPQLLQQPSAAHHHSPAEQYPLNGIPPTTHRVSTHHRTSSTISYADVDTGASGGQFYPYQSSLHASEFEAAHRGLPQVAVTHDLRGLPDTLMSLENPASYEITPEVFEAFSYAEPITTNMTPAEGYGWVGRS